MLKFRSATPRLYRRQNRSDGECAADVVKIPADTTTRGTGRTDESDHITMMSYSQFQSQARSQDLAQLEESDLTPMVLRSLVAGHPFSRLPFLCPSHPVVQLHAKERMFVPGMLDTKGVTRVGRAVARVRKAWIEHSTLLDIRVSDPPVSLWIAHSDPVS